MIDADLLKPIIDEIHANPLPVSNYRQKTTPNKQSIFGVVSRRGQPAEYSKLCVSHPALYKLLLDLGNSLTLPFFSSVLISECTPHNIKVKTASGSIAIVSCDEEGQGGVLLIQEAKDKIQEPSTYLLLVFYNAPNSSWLPAPSVVYHNGALAFKRGDEIMPPTNRRSKKSVDSIWIEHRAVAIFFP